MGRSAERTPCHQKLPAIEQAWETAAPGVDVLIGATAEETRFFAVIDPTFN